MNHITPRLILATVLLHTVAGAQTSAPSAAPDSKRRVEKFSWDPLPQAAERIEEKTPAPVFSGTTANPVASGTTAAPGTIRLNFQNASLADVLSYLSEAAGFIIVQESQPVGTVSVVSKQPINPEEAVDLLNAVLLEKGYTAIRNGRILKIVARSDAQRKDLPVMAGSDPMQIPRKDQMVTQILPVRYLEAAKLVENLRPLLSADSSISANESSNALLLADTQTNVHRIAEIIRALDTSVSSISTIQVFPLQFADSKSLATVLTQLYTIDSSSTSRPNPQPGGGGGRWTPPWAMAAAAQTPQSPAQQAAKRVIAVSDDQSNSVVVSAPEEAMATITDIVHRLDTNIAGVTETRIFQLEHADATELANILASLYADYGSTPSTPGAANPAAGRASGRPGVPITPVSAQAGQSARALLQARVVAVPDPRTNSVLVNAARETMTQVALMIGRLDMTDTKKQHVYIYPLDNADPDNVATILRGMFSGQGSGSGNGTQPSSSRLNQRSQTGASTDVTDIMNTGKSSGRLR